jgi:hypothetical protein
MLLHWMDRHNGSRHRLRMPFINLTDEELQSAAMAAALPEP